MQRCSERGAAAVEFALTLPVLIVVVLGAIELGWAFQSQANLSAAAREGVRVAAIQHQILGPTAARAAAIDRVQEVDPSIPTAAIGVEFDCGVADGLAKVTITFDHEFLTGFFGSGIGGLEGKGAMRCNG